MPVQLLEAHPHSTQMFVPMVVARYLVLVAPDGPSWRPRPRGVAVFSVRAGSGHQLPGGRVAPPHRGPRCPSRLRDARLGGRHRRRLRRALARPRRHRRARAVAVRRLRHHVGGAQETSTLMISQEVYNLILGLTTEAIDVEALFAADVAGKTGLYPGQLVAELAEALGVAPTPRGLRLPRDARRRRAHPHRGAARGAPTAARHPACGGVASPRHAARRRRRAARSLSSWSRANRPRRRHRGST